ATRIIGGESSVRRGQRMADAHDRRADAPYPSEEPTRTEMAAMATPRITDADVRALPDVTDKWAVRLARVLEVNRRIKTEGIARPPRDPEEQEFLRQTGQEGPFKSTPRTRVNTPNAESRRALREI